MLATAVCVSVPRDIPTLLHGPGCNLVAWYGVPSGCAVLGGFASWCPGFVAMRT